MITTAFYHSLCPIKPEGCSGEPMQQFTLCRNEAFSFQLAYKITDGSGQSMPFYVKLITDLDITVYSIGCVPVMHADYGPIQPVQPIGMYPDILIPKGVNVPLKSIDANVLKWGGVEIGEKISLCAYNDSWQGLWLAVNEDGGNAAPGQHNVRVELYTRDDCTLIGASDVTLTVLDADLPKQSTFYTNWFHYDCLADMYRVPIFSEPFFDIMRDFVRKAVRNGMNMLLLPAFTPSLDTPIGEERMTAQLVKVRVEDGNYHFDFSLLKRFVDMCREDGITYFEHAHFFTQWGAEHAPKIVAEVDGECVQIFGWDTEATGEEYCRFLRSYLTALKPFLKEEHLEDKILFHISDEPNENNYQNYEKAYGQIRDLLEEYMVGDALFDPQYYESGLVKIPIAVTRRVQEFVGKGDNIWCYYTGGECMRGCSNRLMQLPRERNRYLGVQMYYYNIKGFLHWAYNYYYGGLSQGMFDPFLNPCGGSPNAGTSYSVYPARDGTAWQSVRQKIFAEGLTDIRALQLLESLADRATCERLIEAHFGVPDFFCSPDEAQALIAFRQAVNEEIQRYTRGE